MYFTPGDTTTTFGDEVDSYYSCSESRVNTYAVSALCVNSGFKEQGLITSVNANKGSLAMLYNYWPRQLGYSYTINLHNKQKAPQEKYR